MGEENINKINEIHIVEKGPGIKICAFYDRYQADKMVKQYKESGENLPIFIETIPLVKFYTWDMDFNYSLKNK